MTYEESAIKAAQCASIAASELLRFQQDGPIWPLAAFGEADPIMKLLEALIRTGEIERSVYSRWPVQCDALAIVDQLLANLKTAYIDLVGRELDTPDAR